MNLFQKHSEQNQEEAKALLFKTIKSNIKKYVLVQIEADKILLSGSKSKKAQSLLTRCLKLMSDHQGIASEGAKTFQLMFDEEIDMNKLVGKIADKYYPIKARCNCKKCVARRESIENNNNNEEMLGVPLKDFDFPEGLPDELKDLFGKISKSIKGTGMEAKVRVMNIKEEAEKLNLDLNNYSSPEEAVEAIKKAQKAKEKIRKGAKPETVINDAIIKSIEDGSIESNSEEKPN